MQHKEFYTTTELAHLLGMTRVAVFQKIKGGEIPAKKAGRNFLVAKKDIIHLVDRMPTANEKKEIQAAVKKTVKQYAETLRRLAKE